MTKFPPRGSGRPGVRESAPRAEWLAPEHLDASWTYDESGKTPGVLLGCHGKRLLGYADDRHIVTIAGSRAGKSRSVLIPNLKSYKGSVVVIDPKGELARETAGIRHSWGHKVFILNPFNVHGWGTNGHNPFKELLNSPVETLTADIAQVSEGMIIGELRQPHFTDASKSLLTGLQGHKLTTTPDELSMASLRKAVSDTNVLVKTLEEMALNDELDGAISNIGASFLPKFRRSKGGNYEANEEMQSVLAVANAQTRPFDDLSSVFAKHDFSLESLGGDSDPTTIYLILPAMRINTHARWLRLFIYQLLAALERKPIPRGKLPLWLILEEFAALGHMQAVEAAAGYFAGFGVKLWTVLQDLTQIKTHYPNSWETFLGNAGVIQAFGNVDLTTTKYLSELLGETTVTEERRDFVTAAQTAQGDDGVRLDRRSVPLLASSEIRMHFARNTGRQLILVPGQPPVFMDKLSFTDGEG